MASGKSGRERALRSNTSVRERLACCSFSLQSYRFPRLLLFCLVLARPPLPRRLLLTLAVFCDDERTGFDTCLVFFCGVALMGFCPLLTDLVGAWRGGAAATFLTPLFLSRVRDGDFVTLVF